MTFSEDSIQLLLAALKFSADRHRNQRRKGADARPYINHPIEVAELLWRVGGVRDINTLMGALLHDVLEDTDTSPDEISSPFGEEVLKLVLEVTDDKKLPKHVRKQLQIENAPHKSLHAQLVKLADKISNIREISDSPPRDWSLARRLEYFDWSEKVVAGLRGVNAALENLYDESLAAGRKKMMGNRVKA